MLYQFLRLIVLIAIRIFFKSIHLKNVENVPRKGAVILVANHPSTFLDPLVGALFVPRKIHFLANGGIFKIPLVAWLLKKLYTIPIYRQQDSTVASSKNEDSFRACYELLEQKGAIIIFPEGTSEDERKLRKIKTGTARIALGAEAKNNFELDVKIVCIGINYTNPRKFQSRLMVSFDEAISIKSFKDRYLQDDIKTVQDLTNEIKERLEAMIVITENKKIDELVEKIERLYTNILREELHLQSHETEQLFVVAQHFADAVHYFEARQPERVNQLQANINQYFSLLTKYQLSDSLIVQPPLTFKDKISNLFFLVLCSPIYLYGLIHNFLPYELPALITHAITKDITYHAPMNITFGIITFIGAYIAYAFGFYHYFPQVGYLLTYLISIGLAGFFAYRYWYFLLDFVGKWRTARLVKKDKLNEILELRKLIIRDLESAKQEYLESIS
ncbi:MAG: lysophospholipid acyltransferase family protein [Thermoflexibacter sp.]|nr:lysophospholipid acyltransferase family protein [Thermoflexibacter sp.]